MVACIICLPCILVLSSGAGAPEEESFGFINIVGLVWFGFLVLGGFSLITPKWMRDELRQLTEDDV